MPLNITRHVNQRKPCRRKSERRIDKPASSVSLLKGKLYRLTGPIGTFPALLSLNLLHYPFPLDDRSLIHTISLLAVFISCLLAFFLVTVQSKHQLSNQLFGVFILLNALDISSWFLDGYLVAYPNILLFKSTMSLLINPIFYLYALSVCYTNFRLRPQHLWHLLPFGLLVLGLLPHFYLVQEGAKRTFLEQYLTQPETTINLWLGEGQFVGYTIAVFITLKKFKRTYSQKHTNTASINYDWLFQLTAILTVLHVMVMVKNGLPFTPYQHWFIKAEVVVGLNATCFLSWFVLKALYNPTLFRPIDTIPGLVNLILTDKPSPVITHPAITTSIVEAQLGRLKEHMEQAEPFLDPDLTIQNLATQLQLPVRELSVLINHHLGQHFFDFVNEYRIFKAMRLLTVSTHPQKTVLEILYAVGFNSKSSFNTCFKKHTGLTPTQYRRNVGQAEPSSQPDFVR